MFGFNEKTYTLFTDEKNITTVLDVVNRHCRITSNRRAGNCHWAGDPTRWFVMFNTNDKRYAEIIKDLQKIGQINISVRGNNVDLVFEI